ncbi:restriction endonuclease subunit S [Xenorhabdus bovienii]|uniref:restriction endonuclease subunit S n=1 Tax=Xenorhabdus bovienii TaxID=40576 RepID=UPI00237C9D92|nr:restriction endonuclease subunit S [Xenorhabdus bovienii]MDE1483057.1 restriction endonuclease subunit S [Xenorhabdus bovienii]MDE1491643.1 restriction endonuclease subunit S [Xenorhabdus bovienii]MDE9434071.1 restriction endonuclease subunit S [Xenorhabdus bovienii]MDE9442713.1 restriction endonuclease subunit S [Xenorhabdus bovienii]MDE9459252.1 restriction endonuclease subunit S [Xenorhabdus bovienii]
MSKTLMKLGDIADVRSGYTLREAITPVPGGDVRILQIKDIELDWQWDPDILPAVSWEQNALPPLLEHGQIVVAARGNRNTAAVYRGDIPVVATNQFLVVTLKKKENGFVPEYLGWVLNQPMIQLEFQRSGSNIQLITKAALMQVPIPVPEIEIQHQIGQLQRIWHHEDDLIKKLQNNRRQLEVGILQKLLKD